MSPLRQAALALAVLAAAPLAAQSADPVGRLAAAGPRLLFAAVDSVKTNDGSIASVRTTLRFDPAAGTYTHRIEDAEGRVLSERVTTTTLAAPTAEEDAAARALITADPGVARRTRSASHAVRVEGGFPLVREPGHPCGPGSRCLSYDVVEQTPDGPRRLRYVIVDLRRPHVVAADADPVADGNLGHPDARRQSRTF